MGKVKGNTAIIYSRTTRNRAAHQPQFGGYGIPTLHEPLVCSEVQRQQRLEFQRQQRQPQQQQRQQRESLSGGHEFTYTHKLTD
jgi:hypothetical protein